MRTFDLAPLYRATVGFDQIADLMDRLLTQDTGANNYPPYNIEKLDDGSWRISIAVAGFSSDELSAEVRENALIVTARKVEDTAERTDKVLRQTERATREAEVRAAVYSALGTTDYDGLTVEEVARRIDGLPAEQLEKVREFEKNNKDRETLVAQIDRKMRANS